MDFWKKFSHIALHSYNFWHHWSMVGTQTLPAQCSNFYISHELSENAFFYQEERHKQGILFCLVFKTLHVLNWDLFYYKFKTVIGNKVFFVYKKCLMMLTPIVGLVWAIGHIVGLHKRLLAYIYVFWNTALYANDVFLNHCSLNWV